MTWRVPLDAVGISWDEWRAKTLNDFVAECRRAKAPTATTRNTIERTPLWIVGVDSAKNVVLSHLKIEQRGPGYSHFPAERSEEWFEHSGQPPF